MRLVAKADFRNIHQLADLLTASRLDSDQSPCFTRAGLAHETVPVSGRTRLPRTSSCRTQTHCWSFSWASRETGQTPALDSGIHRGLLDRVGLGSRRACCLSAISQWLHSPIADGYLLTHADACWQRPSSVSLRIHSYNISMFRTIIEIHTTKCTFNHGVIGYTDMTHCCVVHCLTTLCSKDSLDEQGSHPKAWSLTCLLLTVPHPPLAPSETPAPAQRPSQMKPRPRTGPETLPRKARRG